MSQPNIIYIMADDMGYGDVAWYNAKTKIPTPNMDRIAREGVYCTDAHSASAVCSPSRYAVMTGKFGWRSSLKRGVLNGFGAPLIEHDQLTVARLLKEQGYATAAIGKWHLGLNWSTDSGERIPSPNGSHFWSEDGFDIDYTRPVTGGPNELGFDYSFCIAGSLDMPPYCFIENGQTVGIPDQEKQPYYNQQRRGLMTPGWKDEAVDTTFASKSVAFIEQHTASHPDQPFFLYLTPSAPHRPCDIRPAFVIDKSQAGDRGDMVYLFDWVVGQVLDALDRLDIADDTFIMLTSDNGARLVCADGNDYGHKSNGNLRGQKADIWEGGHREPFLARWPGHIDPGTATDALICLSDVMATCAAITGADLAADTDSFNMLPHLTNQKAETPVRETLVHHSAAGMFSIRADQWKLILGLGSGGFSEPKSVEPTPGQARGQLYDLSNDLAETNNLWTERPDIVQALTRKLQAFVQNDAEIGLI